MKIIELLFKLLWEIFFFGLWNYMAGGIWLFKKKFYYSWKTVWIINLVCLTLWC